VKQSIVLVSALLLLPLMGCKPGDNGGAPGDKQGRGEFRRLCHDDMEKLCPNLTGRDRGRCMRQNIDKASQACQDAFKARIANRKKRKQDAE
jgi:hypothetical protein